MFYKFPSTRYIETNFSMQRADKILSKNEVEEILRNFVIIEEKIDGANLGISFDSNGNILFQNRGSYLMKPFEGQWTALSNWISCHESKILM